MINKIATLLRVLEDTNPWWRDPAARCARDFPFKRSEFSLIRQRMSMETRRARILRGPRAVGKTTLLRQWIDYLLDSGVPGQQIICADFDDPRIPREITLDDVRQAVNDKIRPQMSSPLHFVIDEIQQSPEWARWLRRLVDQTKDIYLATDSAAAILSTGTVETGQARFDDIPIGYLNFRDFYFLRVRPTSSSIGGDKEEIYDLRAAQEVEAYLTFGGFPGHVFLPSMMEARRLTRQDIEQKAILKDIGRLAGTDIDFLRDLFVSLIEESGGIFDATKWSRNLAEQPARQKITAGLRLLESTCLLRELPRYGTSRRYELRAHPKIYATDPGLVSAFSRVSNPGADPITLGRMVETAVFRHLDERVQLEGGHLFFYNYKNKSECDFVVSLDKTKILIEATASLAMDADKARGLSAVCRKLQRVEKTICVSRCRSEARHPSAGIEIHEMPLWSFLDRVSRGPLEELLR
jgi:predicted AAA+ superfamily ATPase